MRFRIWHSKFCMIVVFYGKANIITLINWFQICTDGSALTAALKLRSFDMVSKPVANRDVCCTVLQEGVCLCKSFAYVVES